MIAYLRYSPKPKKKDDPGEASESITTQRDQINQWIQDRRMPQVDEWLIDEETSARKTPLGKREAGAKLLKAVRQGERDVVVARLDRIFRNVIDGLTVLEDWKKKGVILHTTNGVSVDVSTASGWICACVLLANAEFEPKMTAERTSVSKLSQQKRGKKVSSQPPYGQRLDGGQIIDDPAEQEAIEEIVGWKQKNPEWGPRRLARMADEHNLPCRGKRWHHTSIQRLLRSHERNK